MAQIHVSKTNDEKIINEVKDFLNTHKKMVLSIVGIDGNPNSSLLLYVIDDDFNFYFGTCRCFGKYEALRRNPNVAIAVVGERVDPLRVLDVTGVAEEIEQEKTQEMLDWFTSKNQSKYYIKDKEDYVMFKVTPKNLRWADATSGELYIYDLDLS